MEQCGWDHKFLNFELVNRTVSLTEELRIGETLFAAEIAKIVSDYRLPF